MNEERQDIEHLRQQQQAEEELTLQTKLKMSRELQAETWLKRFDERQQKEIKFCRVYADKFAHGTDGHNLRMIVAKMAQLLDKG